MYHFNFGSLFTRTRKFCGAELFFSPQQRAKQHEENIFNFLTNIVIKIVIFYKLNCRPVFVLYISDLNVINTVHRITALQALNFFCTMTQQGYESHFTL